MAFGKANEESIGLLKDSTSKLDGNTYTKYGTLEKYKDKNSSIGNLFRYASRTDVVFMFTGILCSIIHGSSFPVLALIFGQMTNILIRQSMVPIIHLSNIVNSSYNIPELTTQNNYFINIPPTITGDVSDFVNFNSSNLPFNYTNIFNSNDIKMNLLLNNESSTHEAFFMSKMERLTTVKNITSVHLKQTINNLYGSSSNDEISSEEFYSLMTTFALYYLYIGCVVLIVASIQTYCWEISCERQIHHLRKIFYRQVLRQEINWYDLNDGGDLSTKLLDDLERIREGIGSKFSMIIQYISTFFSGIAIGLYVNWRLTLIILCVAPFLIIVTGALAIISANTTTREYLKYALAGDIAEEVLSNIQTIAALGSERKESKRYALAIVEGRKLAMKKYYIFSLLFGSVFIIMYSAYGLAFWYGSNMITEGISSPGSIFTVFLSVMAGAFSVGNVLTYINTVSIAINAASTIFNIIDCTPVIDPYSSQGKKIRKIQGKIEFKNVSFTYPIKSNVTVLNNLSLIVEPGQTVAIVDRFSKSTIGSLLFRFYDPTEGQILLDDADLKILNLHWLRENIGIVSEKTVLFGVSIAENIRYGQPNCTQQDIIDAAMTANAHSFIIKLPKGYNTLVGDKGIQLSTSQKQRISIACVLLKDPKILLLDEVTSTINLKDEKIVHDALVKAQKDKTTIIITHRLSLIKHVDNIYVLQDGKIIETGTHDLLLSNNGLYSNLVKTQIRQVNDDSNKEKSLGSDESLNDNKSDDKYLFTESITSTTVPSTSKNNAKLAMLTHYEIDDAESNKNTEVQSTISEDPTKIITAINKKNVVEKCIKPEKVFTDSFITEDVNGRKVNVTRKVSSRIVKRIIYSHQSSTDSEADSIYSSSSSIQCNLKELSQPDGYSECEILDVKYSKDFDQTTHRPMSSTNSYLYKNGKHIIPKLVNVGVKDLLKVNCPEWPWLLMGFIGSALAGTIMPVFAIFYGQVFTTFTFKGDELLLQAAFWSKMYIALALTSGIAWWMQAIGLTYACEMLIMRLRIQAFKNVLRQPIFFFNLKSSSPDNIMTRLARDAPLVKSAAGLRVSQVLSVFITLFTSLIIAFTFGWKLAIVLIFCVPIVYYTTYKQLMLVRKNKKRNLERMNEADQIASETITSIKTVQGLAQELLFVTQYENSLEQPFKMAKKQVVPYAIMYGISHAIIYGMYSVAFMYGTYLIEMGDMSATDVYKVFFALTFCAVSVGQSSAYLQDYDQAKNAAINIFQLIWRKSEIDPLLTSGSQPEIKGKVQFIDVKFKYPTRPNVYVLQGLNFTVEPGKTLAIIGEPKCGKSTIISLLERFYDPSKGVIKVDNYDIRALNLRHLRKQIGIITREPVLFKCSIKDNIAYGVNDRKVTMDEIIEVAKKANIHNFITTLAQRYDTIVGDCGNELSIGKKQRVAIARVLLRNPKILLLDEVTSAVNTENETVVVQNALDLARKGRTCIIITHKLSTIQLADSIAVVHKGKIVEQGNHEELKSKKRYYYQLINHQEETLHTPIK